MEQIESISISGDNVILSLSTFLKLKIIYEKFNDKEFISSYLADNEDIKQIVYKKIKEQYDTNLKNNHPESI